MVLADGRCLTLTVLEPNRQVAVSLTAIASGNRTMRSSRRPRRDLAPDPFPYVRVGDRIQVWRPRRRSWSWLAFVILAIPWVIVLCDRPPEYAEYEDDTTFASYLPR